MQIENNIKLMEKKLSTGRAPEFNKSENTFHDILKYSMKQVSGLRPPKIELTGVLVPITKLIKGQYCRFKLETKFGEYFLNMSPSLAKTAQKIEWDMVTVKGHFDSDEVLFEVEKIRLAQKIETEKTNSSFIESYFELDHYKKAISKIGKIELAPDFAAS